MYGVFTKVLDERRIVVETYITPPPYTFWSLWSLIYIWNFAWMFYALGILCRPGHRGSFLYIDPPYMPMSLYVPFAFTNIFSIAWLFLYDRFVELWISNIPLALMAFFGIMAVAGSVHALHQNKTLLKSIGRKSDICWTIGLVHNGTAMYATWAAVATLVQFVSTLIIHFEVTVVISCIVALGVLSLEVLLWFILDNFVFWRATKYLFTPYIVVIYVLITILIDHEWGANMTISIFVAALLGVSGLFFLIKIILTCARSNKGRAKTETKNAPTSRPVVYQQAQPMTYIVKQPTTVSAQTPTTVYVQRPNSMAMQPTMVQTLQPGLFTTQPTQPGLYATQPNQANIQYIM